MTTNTCKKTLAFVYKPPTSELTSLWGHNNLCLSCWTNGIDYPQTFHHLQCRHILQAHYSFDGVARPAFYYYNFLCLKFLRSSMPNEVSNIGVTIHIWRPRNIIELGASNCCIDTIYLWSSIIGPQGNSIASSNKEGVFPPDLAVG